MNKRTIILICVLIVLGVCALGLGLGFGLTRKPKSKTDTDTNINTGPTTDTDTDTNINTGSTTTKNYVNFSNSIRKQCGSNTGSLVFSSEMEKLAQDYANKMKNCNCMSHYLYDGCSGCNGTSENTTYEQTIPSGQNLYKRITSASVSDEQLYKDAINSWAGEGFDGSSTNHYTTMNWTSGTTIGCGIASKPGTYNGMNVNYYYVSCQYGAPSVNELPNVNPTPTNLAKEVLCTKALEIKS